MPMVRAPKPVTAVNRMSWTRKQLALIAATAALAGAAACLWLGSTEATSFPSARADVEWQCSRTALLLTTCSKVRHAEPAIQNAKPVIHGSRKEPICLRRA